LKISILREQLCMKGALVELDDVNRERHGEILGAAQMTEREREVCTPTLCALLSLAYCCTYMTDA
jgi:hypothetical protein